MYSSSNTFVRQEISHKRYFLSAVEIVNDMEINEKKQTISDLQDKIDMIKLNIQDSESHLQTIVSEKDKLLRQMNLTTKYNQMMERKLQDICKSIILKRSNILKIFRKLKAANFTDILVKFSQEKRGFQSNLFEFFLANKNVNIQSSTNSTL